MSYLKCETNVGLMHPADFGKGQFPSSELSPIGREPQNTQISETSTCPKNWNPSGKSLQTFCSISDRSYFQILLLLKNWATMASRLFKTKQTTNSTLKDFRSKVDGHQCVPEL